MVELPVAETEMRIYALLAIGFLVLLGSVSNGFAQNPEGFIQTLEGYAWPASVRQGQSVGLFISSSTPTVNVEIIRQGWAPTTVRTVLGVPTSLQKVSKRAYSDGCNWTQTLSIPIPDTWPSGVYVARLVAPGTNLGNRYAIFAVKENDPGSTSGILLVLTNSTWQAYNNWGGKSVYEFNSVGGTRSSSVSFRRPYAEGNGQGFFEKWELPFLQWAESKGYTMEVATSLDLHGDPGLEAHYSLLLSVGHDEYWSKEMRNAVEHRITSGRNVAFLTGNTCWWQVRFSPSLDRMICFKNKNQDPFLGVDNSRVTVNWWDVPVARPENSLTGVSYRKGGYVNSHGYYPASKGYGGYKVWNSGHWVYEGTGFSDGDEFGYAASIVGYETDGALLSWVHGEPKVTGQDGTPLNYMILGTSPASYGYATMGIYSGPGIVFNAATTNWSLGLASDAGVQQITHNLLDRLTVLTSVQTAVPEDQLVGIGILRNAPNPFSRSTEISFELPRETRVRLTVFDVAGSRVATLVDERLGAGPHIVPWNGMDALGRDASPGIYLFRLEAGEVVRTGKALKAR